MTQFRYLRFDDEDEPVRRIRHQPFPRGIDSPINSSSYRIASIAKILQLDIHGLLLMCA